MKEEVYTTYTLENGMRVVHIPSPTDVAYCGIAIDAGSRDERDNEQGMAHFCEHMLFKGTLKRKAWHILQRMDRVGGDLNAYTNKEETVVYAAFMKEHFARAVELLADIVFNSQFPQHEIDKEVEVIVEEIDSYKDSPSELIFDQFENMIYSGHPLGHDILGEPDVIRQFSTDDALRFKQRNYKPENMVFFVLGKFSKSRVRTVLDKYVAHIQPDAPVEDTVLPADTSGSVLRNDKKRLILPPYIPQKKIVNRGTHQAHVMLGCRAYPSNDDRRIALYFLNNILGGPGMNSVLNIALRENFGLVYTVESNLTNYTDTGTFGVYFGCDTNDVDHCLALIRREFDKLMTRPLSAKQMAAALKQIRGQIGVACDNFENYALDTAKSFLHYDKFEGIEDTVKHLSRITPEMITRVANEILAEDNLSCLIYS